MTFDYRNLITIALNTGNAENVARLIDGGITGPAGNIVPITQPDIDRLTGHLTKNDWDMVQSIWDMLETLRPGLETVHQELTGVDMRVVQPGSGGNKARVL